MIDILSVKETYSKMLDTQLINLAVEDGHTLPPQALLALKEEFAKRNLDQAYIESAEQTKQEIHQRKIEDLKVSSEDDFNKLIWSFIFEEKEKGTSDDEILKGLLERGLDEEQGKKLLLTTSDKLKTIVDDYDTKMLAGGLSFLLGVFITLVTYTHARASGGIYIIAWGAILFGAIKFSSGLSAKRKNKKLLAKIEVLEQ
ncbi:hypothetical protein [Ferruginibacter albus]|uniref:hypothetical protein n=1 Tax=Ferruginibacter albus TaxID=2875540 RepID=UPI001CC45348|nr:hypothetical protein [Ferruginibacter albus]UAY52346.1 hypothetical protein K9M53_01315 [Ferruginibacter albus]